jgi:hypothetical protein
MLHCGTKENKALYISYTPFSHMTGKMNGQFRHQSLKETEAAVNGKALYLAIIFYMSHDP